MASRFVAALAERSLLVGEVTEGEYVLVDVDDTIIEVHGYAKQGAGFGYTAAIGEDAWTRIQYTDAIYDEATQPWISRAEVAEILFTAFASRRQSERVPGRFVVRRNAC